jgi:hypothetical protein
MSTIDTHTALSRWNRYVDILRGQGLLREDTGGVSTADDGRTGEVRYSRFVTYSEGYCSYCFARLMIGEARADDTCLGRDTCLPADWRGQPFLGGERSSFADTDTEEEKEQQEEQEAPPVVARVWEEIVYNTTTLEGFDDEPRPSGLLGSDTPPHSS